MPTLPEELLALIFEQLASPCIFELDEELEQLYNQYSTTKRSQLISDHAARILTLRSICLASKSMHRLAWPILFRDFSNRRNDDIEETGLEPGYETPTRRLLRTICLTPHYGLAIRNLLIRSWTPVDAMHGEELFDLLQSDATVSALFQWRARGFWFRDGGFVDSLHRALGLGHEDGLVSLLLIMCPNIRELELEPSIDFNLSLFISLLGITHDERFVRKPLPEREPDFEQDEADYIIAQMFGTPWPDQKWQKPPFLRALRKLTLWGPGLANLDLACIAQLLTLPSLLTFKSYGMNYRGNSELLFEAFVTTRRRSKLKRLEVFECQAGADVLSEMLQFCPKLEELAVVWDKYDAALSAHQDDDYCLLYGNITRIVAKCTPHLRKLTLDGSRGWPNIGAEPCYPFIIGDKLNSMENLEHLTLDAHAIYGSEHGKFGSALGANVPKSVTNLTLISGDYDPGNDQITPYHLWQDDDLIDFLKDPNFDSLSDIQLPGRTEISIQDQAAVEKHGWKTLPRHSDEALHLVRPSRLRDESAHPVIYTANATAP